MRRYMFLILLAAVLVGCTSQAPQEIKPAEEPSMQQPDEQQESTGEVKEVRLEAYNWGFRQSGDEIQKGDKVRLVVTSTSGTHGVAIPDFGVSVGPVSPGQEQVVEFTADQSGSFTYFCNIPCGRGHSSMRGTLNVG